MQIFSSSEDVHTEWSILLWLSYCMPVEWDTGCFFHLRTLLTLLHNVTGAVVHSEKMVSVWPRYVYDVITAEYGLSSDM